MHVPFSISALHLLLLTDAICDLQYALCVVSLVQDVYDTFSRAAEMNPDDDEEDEGMEGLVGVGGDHDGWIYNEEEVQMGAREAQIAAHLDSVLQISPALAAQQQEGESGQFDDADEEEDDDDLL